MPSSDDMGSLAVNRRGTTRGLNNSPSSNTALILGPKACAISEKVDPRSIESNWVKKTGAVTLRTNVIDNASPSQTLKVSFSGALK